MAYQAIQQDITTMFSRLVNRLVFWRTPEVIAAAKALKSQSFPKAPASSSFLRTVYKKTLVTAIRATYHIHPMVVDYLCLLYAIGAFAPSDDEQDEKQTIHKSNPLTDCDAGIKFRILDRLLFRSRGGLGMIMYQGSPNGSHCTTSFFVPSDYRLLQNQGAPLSNTRHSDLFQCHYFKQIRHH
ncbi:hypothetical protein K492DRAFT_199998 [Lichtheimia hyalospora FSU 10163]|nr:hypothetical protein K492DRAFT_199998 [Lichtheimia hyalospora FSU 10163]